MHNVVVIYGLLTLSNFFIFESIFQLLLFRVQILNPTLWGIEHPDLYEVEVKVISENNILDSQTIKTGIRKAELKADGFYLNDENWSNFRADLG